MTKADKILTAVILLLAVLTFSYNTLVYSSTSPGQTASIKAQGETVRVINLSSSDADQVFTVNGKIGPAVIEVSGGKIRLIEAPCPDQICLKRGWLSRPGEAAICVPNEIIITIAADNNEIDATTQ